MKPDGSCCAPERDPAAPASAANRRSRNPERLAVEANLSENNRLVSLLGGAFLVYGIFFAHRPCPLAETIKTCCR
jgi:hypothetical protein